ncbi:MAG TPA: N-acetylglucosamine-6-phosphate deacetylase [Actinobacteria bacterium]|nr:N-acetylglucosamine-6-phosphate deacetylase [Actinomycetota bacterium]
MKLYIKGGKIFLSDSRVLYKTIVIEDKIICDIIPNSYKPGNSDKVVDATGKWVVPGFIDIHAHGALGKDTMDSTRDAIHTIGKFFAAHGVTSYLPTVWTSTPELMMKAIDNVANCPQPEDGASHLGVHVEGPYLSMKHRGAQLKGLIRKPDPIEYQKWLNAGVVKLITIAPENKGALEFIDIAVKQGVEFSIGHSGASYEQVIMAADHGVKQATHLYNGMLGIHHRNPGTAGAILTDDRIFAQIIADGVHVHPAMIKLAVRAKGTSRIILITDSIRGTGLPDGDYDYYGQKFIVKDGVARTPEGGLSGSTLMLDQALRNMIKFTGMSLSEVLPMATSVPAEAMGWQNHRGVLKQGADADVVILDEDFNVERTFVLGKEIYYK